MKWKKNKPKDKQFSLRTSQMVKERQKWPIFYHSTLLQKCNATFQSGFSISLCIFSCKETIFFCPNFKAISIRKSVRHKSWLRFVKCSNQNGNEDSRKPFFPTPFFFRLFLNNKLSRAPQLTYYQNSWYEKKVDGKSFP